MTRRLTVFGALGVAALALLVVACGGDEEGEPTGAAEAVTIDLAEESDSGQTGEATLTPTGEGQTAVTVELTNPPDNPQPVHIHPGTCDNLDPAPQFPLDDLVDGTSETTVDVSLEELQSGEFAINAHKSAEEIEVYVACGNIPGGG